MSKVIYASRGFKSRSFPAQNLYAHQSIKSGVGRASKEEKELIGLRNVSLSSEAGERRRKQGQIEAATRELHIIIGLKNQIESCTSVARRANFEESLEEHTARYQKLKAIVFSG